MELNLRAAVCLRSWDVPRTFSSCSTNNYEKYLMTRQPSCLMDKPNFMSVVTPSVCGNGFVEKGEQCDCGTLEVRTAYDEWLDNLSDIKHLQLVALLLVKIPTSA